MLKRQRLQVPRHELKKIDRLYGLRNKDAKKLNLFLDKYSDAEPIDDSIDDGGRITKKNIEEIREHLQ